MNKVVRTVELPADLDAAVERLAVQTAQTPSEVVSAAVEQLLVSSDDLAIDAARWAEYERTGKALDEDEVAALLQTLKSSRSRPSQAT